MHGTPDLNHRHPPAFESHDSASMGELRFPCDIIMVTLVAGDGHGAGKNGIRFRGKRFKVLGSVAQGIRHKAQGTRRSWRAIRCFGLLNPKSKPSDICFLSNADPGYALANAYSPACARHVHDPVDHRICWLQ